MGGFDLGCENCGVHFVLSPGNTLDGAVTQGLACPECGGTRLFRNQPSPTRSDGTLRNMVDSDSQKDQGGNPMGEGTIMGNDGEVPFGSDTHQRDNYMHSKVGMSIFEEIGMLRHRLPQENQGEIDSLIRDSPQTALRYLRTLPSTQPMQGSPMWDSLQATNNGVYAGWDDPYGHEEPPPNYASQGDCPQCGGQIVPSTGPNDPHWYCEGCSQRFEAPQVPHPQEFQDNQPVDPIADDSPGSLTIPKHWGSNSVAVDRTLDMEPYEMDGMIDLPASYRSLPTRQTHSDHWMKTAGPALIPAEIAAAPEEGALAAGAAAAVPEAAGALATGVEDVGGGALNAAKGLVTDLLGGGAKNTLKNQATNMIKQKLIPNGVSSLMGGALGAGAAGGGGTPGTQSVPGDAGTGPVATNPGEQTPPPGQWWGSVLDVPMMLVADLETSDSIKSVGEQNGEDPQKVDQKEFNDRDKSPSNLKNPNNEDSGASGEDGVRQDTEGYGFGPNSPAIDRAMMLLPLLIHYYQSEESGESDPLVKGLHDMLEQESPGYLQQKHPESQSIVEQIIQLHKPHPGEEQQHQAGFGGMAPEKWPNPGGGAPAANQVGSMCPACGGVTNPDGSCPQCGTGAQQPGLPSTPARVGALGLPAVIRTKNETYNSDHPRDAAVFYNPDRRAVFVAPEGGHHYAITQEVPPKFLGDNPNRAYLRNPNSEAPLFRPTWADWSYDGWNPDDVTQVHQALQRFYPGVQLDPGDSTYAKIGNTVGPMTPEQKSVVVQYLVDHGRAEEAANVDLHPELFADILAKITRQPNVPPIPDPSQVTPLVPQPSPPGGMPVPDPNAANGPASGAPMQPMSAIHRMADANTRVKRCPSCGSGSTTILMGTDNDLGTDVDTSWDEGHGRCHSCGKVFTLRPVDANEMDPQIDKKSGASPRCPKCKSGSTRPRTGQEGISFECHGCGHIWERKDVDTMKFKSGIQIQGLIDMPNPNLQHNEQGLAWKDTVGQDLVENQEYEISSAAFNAPTYATILKIHPSHLDMKISGGMASMLNPDENQPDFQIPRKEAQLNDYQFTPMNHQADMDDRNTEPPAGTPGLEHIPAQTPTTDETADSFPNTTVSALIEPEEEDHCRKCGSTMVDHQMRDEVTTLHSCVPCGHAWESKDDFQGREAGVDLGWLMSDDTPQDDFWAGMERAQKMREGSQSRDLSAIANRDPVYQAIHDRLESNARTAGKHFTPGEKRALINEHGNARNLEDLDLSNTHYNIREDYSGKANGMNVDEDELFLGVPEFY